MNTRFTLAASFLAVLMFNVPSFSGGGFFGAGKDGGDSSSTTLKPIKNYSGYCRTNPRSSAHHKIIKNKRQYYRFIQTIPKYEIGMGRMPKSKDPLLKRPYINFNRHMLIVVVNPDHMEYYGPMDVSFHKMNGQLEVRYKLKKRPDGEHIQWVKNTNDYEAYVVERFDGKISFKEMPQ